jgi:hypothetical protein
MEGMQDELASVLDELRKAQTALRQHGRSGILVWRGAPPDRTIFPIHRAWLDRYDELKAEVDPSNMDFVRCSFGIEAALAERPAPTSGIERWHARSGRAE